MKIRTFKKGLFICRKRKPSDKSYNIRESYRLAYFEITNQVSYVVRPRNRNNVVAVYRTKEESMKICRFLNSPKMPTNKKKN